MIRVKKLYTYFSKYLLHTSLSIVALLATYRLYDSEPHGIYKVFSVPNFLMVLIIALVIISLITIIKNSYMESLIYVKFTLSVILSLLMFSQFLGSDMFDRLNDPLLNYIFALLIVVGMFITLVIESKLNETSLKLSFAVTLIRGTILIAFPIFAIWFALYIHNTHLYGWLIE